VKRGSPPATRSRAAAGTRASLRTVRRERAPRAHERREHAPFSKAPRARHRHAKLRRRHADASSARIRARGLRVTSPSRYAVFETSLYHRTDGGTADAQFWAIIYCLAIPQPHSVKYNTDRDTDFRVRCRNGHAATISSPPQSRAARASDSRRRSIVFSANSRHQHSQ
jgi:hypothetical protein